MSKQDLIDKVLNQIIKDVSDGDVTCIEQLLTQIDTKFLLAYLPEKD